MKFKRMYQVQCELSSIDSIGDLQSIATDNNLDSSLSL